MAEKKIEERIYQALHEYKKENYGDDPFCILLDPENLFKLQESLDKKRNSYPSLWHEYAHDRTLYGLPIFVRHNWYKSMPNILEVK